MKHLLPAERRKEALRAMAKHFSRPYDKTTYHGDANANAAAGFEAERRSDLYRELMELRFMTGPLPPPRYGAVK